MSSQVSSLPYYSKARRLTAYILLFVQLFLPVSVAFSAAVQAAEQESVDMMNTMNGIQALMQDNGGASPQPTTSPDKIPSGASLGAPDFTVRAPQAFSAPVFSGEESAPLSLHDNTVRQDDILSALPTLGLPETGDENQTSPETQVAQGVSQAGQLLSNGDTVDASIGYARSLGENLINQQITDWLNQYGKARVQLSTDKTGDADLLLPLIDKANSLVFSQVGIRANEDRNTTNLGLGYRQYQADWMWGVNSFYDYDITGGNSRVGVGSELWFDYLKFAGNGYFRLTDWHQSDLHAMRDYDERPANGFDLRAEGYLPSYPQLGAYAKYEQYFGKGISLSDSGVSASDLKDDPSRSTFGVSYTPFPLMTLKGETSRGDSNDSRLGLELTYRFGVPLNQQLDPEYVDLMRNLAGNRYDFVDRNYNIVMQYRKQELLTISLPDSMTAEAAALLPVTATVNKSKYGLKSIAWSAPELIAQGGQIQITSPTTINLTLPAYVFQTRANEPQSYRVSAVGTDNEGNTSNTAVMWVNVKPSQETITSLTLSPGTVLLANNSDTYTATALIQNEKGEALADKDVTFTVSGFSDNEKVMLTGGNGNSGQTVTVRTDNQGQALITIKSKIAGDGILKATMKNGNFRNTTLRFAADASTAQITTLVLTGDKAVANGKASNVAVATVQDQFGNVVESLPLSGQLTNGAQLKSAVPNTNAQGQSTIAFTNMTAGSSDLTVSIPGNGAQKTVTAQFIADISTAKIASVVVDNDDAVANGQDHNTVTVTVVDGNGNVLANAPVTITVPGSGKYSTQPANGLTNSQGQLVINYTNTKAGTENYPVSINNSQEMAVLTFKADSSTARVAQVVLQDAQTSKVANGVNTFTYQALVTDAQGNPLDNMSVAWTQNKGALVSLLNTTTQTNAQGLTSVVLQSTDKVATNIVVSGSVNNTLQAADKVTNFTADIQSAAVVSVTLVDTVTSKVADGKNTFTFKALVKDSGGNPVPNVNVNWQSTPLTSSVIFASSSQTNDDGIATITVTSTTTAVADLLISASSIAGAGVDANQKVSFTADTSTARVVSVVLDDAVTEKVANGTNTFTYTAKVEDANGNPVKGVLVAWSKTAGASLLPAFPGTVTDAEGMASVVLSSTTKMDLNIQVSAQVGATTKIKADKVVSFTADSSTARVSTVTLVGTDVSKVANGTNAFTYTVTVVDTHGNPVAGATVTPASDKTNVNVTVNGATNASGQATITLTSTTQAVADITVNAKVGTTAAVNANKTVSFTADSSTAKVSTVTLVGTAVSQVANGTNAFTYTVQVVDNNGNPVAGATVTPASDKADVKISVGGSTNASGQATITLTSTTKAVADITVSAKVGTTAVVNANKTVSFTADSSTAKVSTVTLVGTDVSKVANGTNAFTYTVTVVDNNGNPVAGATVTPASDKADVNVKVNGITNASGQATITLTSTTKAVADITVSAKVGTTAAVNANKTVSFVADSSTAKVSTVTLNGDTQSQVANGTNAFTYTVTVVDNNGNPVAGATVTPASDKADVNVTVNGSTNASGQATITLTSTTKAVADITVNAKVGTTAAVNANKTVSFVADSSTAKVSTVTLNGDTQSQVANGTNAFTYTVTVVDNNGNPVAGATVTPASDKADVNVKVNGITNASGQATITLTSTTKAVADITVSAKVGTTAAVNANKTVSFVADSSTAKVSTVTLNGDTQSQVANGTNAFTYTVTVVDNNGNPVAGATVTPASDKADVNVTVNGSTNASGQATITLTSTTKAVADITVNAKVGTTAAVNANKTVSFTADSSTAKVSAVTLNGDAQSQVANGTNAFTYTVQVVDNNGNPVAGATVTPASDKADVNVKVNGITNASGQATITLTSTTKAVADITVSAKVGTTAAVNANKTVSFVADSSTAKVSTVTLNGDTQSQVANGTNAFTYTVTVVDNNGNPVAGATVTPASNKADVNVTVNGSTNAIGQATITLTSTTKAVADITVNAKVGTTAAVNANKMVSFTADSSTAKVSTVTLVGAAVSKVANGTNAFTYTVQVVDNNGNPVAGATVTPASDKADVTITIDGTTNASGQATITLTSTTKAVADITVNAKVGTTAAVDADKTVSFTYDISTAKVSTVTLNGDTQSKVANGTNAFTYTAHVVDGNGNPVTEAGVTVNWAQNKGSDVTLPATSTTNASGEATITLTSTTKAVADITVSAKVGTTAVVNADKTVSFTYDISTAKVSTVTLNGDTQSKVANGTNAFTYTAHVVDGNGNPVTEAGVTVNWTQDKGSDVTLPATSTTNASGEATITLTSTTKAVADITVSAKVGTTAVVNADKTVSFTYDISTAKVSTVTLNGDTQSKVANGTNAFTYTAHVVDGNGNPVTEAGVTVNWTQDKGSDVTLPATSTTNASGEATITLTSTTKAVADITVNAKVGTTAAVDADKTVSFTYDISTAKVSTVTLNGDTQSKVANGTNAFTYTAHVVDGNGNPVTEAGVTVNWTQDKGSDVTLPATSTTNASGEATITLTSTTKAVADITVSAKVGTTAAVDADKTVSFTADRNNAVIRIDSTNTKKLVPANGVTEYGLKISVFDLNNNPIADYPVKITNNDNELLTNSNGEIIYGFTSTVIGNNNVSVISVSDSLIKNSIIIRFSLPITILTSPF